MPQIVNSLKRFIIGLGLLAGSAGATVLVYSLYVSSSLSGNEFIDKTIGIALIVGFWMLILLFVRRSKPVIARRLGDQSATILEIFLASISVLIMFFAVLNRLGVSPEALLTGAGFVSITIGLIISTFVGGILAGALVFATHQFRVGDSIIVNNIPGTVAELSALITRIRTDQGLMTIPNSAISSGAIVITRLQKAERIPQQRLPYNLGDRVVTTYMAGGEGTVKELSALRTIIVLDSGREVTFLNSSVLTGTIGVAKITGPRKEVDSA